MPSRWAGATVQGCLLLAVVTAFFFIFACGKKAMPLPPADYELPVTEALSARKVDGQLVLNWPLPDWEGPEGVELAGFRVYRGKLRLESACADCPVRYQQTGEVEIDEISMVFGTDPEYRELLEKGYHYRYKVCAYTRTGREGPDSNIVRVNY